MVAQNQKMPTLGFAGRWRPRCKVDDSLDKFWLNRISAKFAHHSARANAVRELHDYELVLAELQQVFGHSPTVNDQRTRLFGRDALEKCDNI